MCDAILKLKLSLEEKTPALLLGAGFSYGAKNERGELLPMGRELTEKLYKYMFIMNPPEEDILEEDKEGAERYKENGDLKGLCGLLRDEGRVDERNKYLTSIFSGATIDKKSKIYNIKNYKWDKIFTLNIDCLLENIFEQEAVSYRVWNRDNDDRRNTYSDTVIIKLHGCVNNAKAGYIFDDQEYINFLNDDDCFARDFGDAYSKGDMIFIGTEFQEDDLKTIITKYGSKGYDTSANNYFFVCPQINSVRLNRQIRNTTNFYWIPWTAEKFFDFLYDNVSVKKDIKKILLEKGMRSLDDIYKEKGKGYESKLYMGYESQYADFFDEWDIIHPGVVRFEEKIINSKKNLFAVIYGKSYVGKSCIAKRVLIDLRKQGFLAFEFNMRSSEYIHLFREYIAQLPENTKIAVLFDEATFYFNLLYTNLIDKCPSNIKQLIVITSDNSSNYFAKRDILESKHCVETFKTDEHISCFFAEEIYIKLKDKHWLNKPGILGSKKSEIKNYAIQVNDIIEFLYNISHGHGFEAHYEDMFTLLTHDVNYKYLQALAVLEVLGLGSITTRILPSLIKSECNNFNFAEFKKKFDEILLVSDHRVKIRCLRLIQKAIFTDMNKENIINILEEIVRQTYGQFNEGDINEWSEIFQKALTVKKILKEKLLTLEDIRELLNNVEKYGENYSFYWIQRGIAAQKANEFDLADHYFREGIRIRPVSYQARHALAKNLMERAVEQVNNMNLSYAAYYMDEGIREMKSIIDDSAFSRGYKYSLHALIDMSIKYFNACQKIMEFEHMKYIQSKILHMSTKELDTCILAEIQRYIDYCIYNGCSKICEPIILKHYEKIPLIKEITEQDYLIENLDWES
ncbi:SIR2 family protein [Anaerosacchariphilus sp. NSJ-68]|uniref:SIR2 family protein n=2 Tax=Lachnospiraceae TaxID=186803 RepID=A0A923RMT5_9FIRM|nr:MULTISPECIES: SIR2 family protein [Lachnospiraceae]MBC5658705.1 SIR2 family protein [Anaerosacchariphilus hominis]MBC5699026.1 SIR2 family protein [Roseburia difficilis]